MRQAVGAALRDMGFPEIIEVSSGAEAMRILKTTTVAAVISDWNMPGLSGLGLLRWVRSEAALASLPFLLVSAETDRERVRTALECGASEYLIKPYTVQDLANKIGRILGNEQRENTLDARAARQVLGLATASEVEHRLAGASVLVVDDMPFNLKIIVSILSDEYTTLAAGSGRQALEIARSALPPDLILLDVTMPEMDGYEVCRQLKLDPATRDIPVIFLTGNDDIDNVVRGLEIGAVDYITKPAEPSILKARIRTQLRLKLAFADMLQQNVSLASSAKLREDVERITQHDLKNPISAIIAGTEMLLSERVSEAESKEMIALIQAEAWRALDLVNQSLSLYRMETGTFILRAEPVDLLATLSMVRQETLTAFAGRKLDIRIAGEGAAAAGRYIVQGEPGLCHSLFGNLLRNAAQASALQGRIDITLAEEAGFVCVAIHNQGAVPAAIRERFFDKYVSAGKSEGTGLGTYSAKLVTEAQRGNIAMRTDDETGTTLTVRLPSSPM